MIYRKSVLKTKIIAEESKTAFLELLRLGVGVHEIAPMPNHIDWNAVKSLADQHELSAVVLDGTDCLNARFPNLANAMPMSLKLKWIGEVLQNYEHRYVAYEKAISSLARFYSQHGFKMMVLKGYGLSLNYPKPNHRPCGDIDIWLFGKWKEADDVLLSEKGVRIDTSHHHHTVFDWQGFSVENHYNFLNVYHHRSNVEMEVILEELGQDDSFSVEVNGTKVNLPNANLHALFMLRHCMSNFASTGIKLRQLLDWAFFARKHKTDIDWGWLDEQLAHFGMKKLSDIINAICVCDLGFEDSIFPNVQYDPALKERVLNDMLSPEFSEKEPDSFVFRAVFKYRRWKANAWKHELCFKESLWSAFWSGVVSHLMKPQSI